MLHNKLGQEPCGYAAASAASTFESRRTLEGTPVPVADHLPCLFSGWCMMHFPVNALLKPSFLPWLPAGGQDGRRAPPPAAASRPLTCCPTACSAASWPWCGK